MAAAPRNPNPQAIEALRKYLTQHLQNPVANYPSRYADADTARKMAAAQNKVFTDAKSFVPRGTEVYRVPSDFDLEKLPTQKGKSFKPGQPMSVAGASDLQELGKMLEGKSGIGSQATPRQQAILKILAMEDIPGARSVAPYVSPELLKEAGLKEEGIFGPKTRYEVLDYRPAVGKTPATWNLGAYANMGLGAFNILGFLPMINEGGKILQGTSSMLPKVDLRG
jgi:hypothetical protein